jgi:hypothetical protein
MQRQIFSISLLWLFIGIISSLTSGCGDGNLTRSKAANLISSDKKFTELITRGNMGSVKREFVEVTGISEPKSGENFAQATFTWRIRAVEIKQDRDGYERDKAEIEKKREGVAVFQKFDDGWRLAKLSGPGLENW